jgi:general secretion pathway protein B
MSLILDALRKSEEQRRLGQPPSLADEAFLPYPRARVRSSQSAIRYAILLLPLLCLGGVGVWWAKREKAITEQSTSLTLAAAPASSANAKQVENATLPAPTARGAVNTNASSDEGLTQKQNASRIQNQNDQFVPPIPAPIKQAQTATLSEPKPLVLNELTPPQGTQEQAMRNNAVTPNATSSVLEKNVLEKPPINQNKNDPAAAMPTMSSPSSTPDSDRVATVDATPATNSPSSKTDVSQMMTADAKPLTDHRANIIPYIYELPLQVRQSLPAFKVTMRVYDPDPSKRFAIINDLRVAEGVNLDNGMKLIEIGPEDITLEHVGQRFRWSSNGY